METQNTGNISNATQQDIPSVNPSFKSTRFDYVQFDDVAAEKAAAFKNQFIELERMAEEQLVGGRSKSELLTKLEDAYAWVGKAIRDEQIQNRGADLQERRNHA